MVTALSRRDEALPPQEVADYLRRRIGDHLLGTTEEYATFTLHVDAEGYVEAARILKEDDRLAFTMFDCLFGVDAREEGFDVVAVLYSVETGSRVLLRHRCEGGRERPVAPSLTHLFHGANFHERETWDMFGIEFEGHPGLAPRLLCAENFEGWPLRKDFYLASREAKPWPGIKEPAELDEEGNVIERIPGPGDAPGPTALDEAMARQAKLANPTTEAPAELEAEAPEGAEGVVEGPAERVEEDVTDAESDARARAEEQRRAAAEERARRSAEQARGPGSPGQQRGESGSVPEGDPSVFDRDEEEGA